MTKKRIFNVSVRKLNQERKNSTILTIDDDEIIILGGSHPLTAELRSWNRDLEDYHFKDFTSSIDNLDLLYPPYEYSAVLPTMSIRPHRFQPKPRHEFDLTSSFIFGCSLQNYIVEITKEHQIKFYPSPLDFHNQAYQVSVRIDNENALFLGGKTNDLQRSSDKVYNCKISEMSCVEMSHMGYKRYLFTAVYFEVRLYLIEFLLIFEGLCLRGGRCVPFWRLSKDFELV